jgi:hypothetical protein
MVVVMLLSLGSGWVLIPQEDQETGKQARCKAIFVQQVDVRVDEARSRSEHMPAAEGVFESTGGFVGRLFTGLRKCLQNNKNNNNNNNNDNQGKASHRTSEAGSSSMPLNQEQLDHQSTGSDRQALIVTSFQNFRLVIEALTAINSSSPDWYSHYKTPSFELLTKKITGGGGGGSGGSNSTEGVVAAAKGYFICDNSTREVFDFLIDKPQNVSEQSGLWDLFFKSGTVVEELDENNRIIHFKEITWDFGAASKPMDCVVLQARHVHPDGINCVVFKSVLHPQVAISSCCHCHCSVRDKLFCSYC